MKIGRSRVHFHSISVHFTSAIYPVAIFFLSLSFFYRKDFCLFAYFHLMILATISAPISYITGVTEWREKYKGAKVRIFILKDRLSLVVIALGAVCTLWFGLYPGIMEEGGGARIFFLFLNSSIVPPLVYLGALGGRLVFGGAH